MLLGSVLDILLYFVVCLIRVLFYFGVMVPSDWWGVIISVY